MMLKPEDHLAFHLFQAMNGLGTNEEVINEILCTKKPHEEIQAIKNAYRESKYR